ncbi:MAG: alpha-amylase family glycosyl hydrolase, partial [Gloeomargarita sp. DG02_3_bins_56]
TAVELMPIHEFDEQDARPGLANYWGYSTLAFFAPHRAYSADQSLFGPVNEFRDMVKALHRAGIEVILDVVFNHTAEGNHEGPTLSFRGIENQAYYILETLNPAFYANYSGCGNTVKANHEIVGRLILDSLRYWVDVMHVDGFRFDLASILSRSKTGSPLADPPLPWLIESDPVLAGTKIIAEAWDAAGLYQVGSFIGERFAEWNGPFRDDVRRFVKGDRGMLGWLAARLLGSPDLYRDPHQIPNRTINFVTCHDGFTLYDLVSYNHKHNEANGEQNRDGSNDNYSWNCGWEGPTDDPEISALRVKQMKNFLVILALAQGTPMILMGDEVCRTQRGNNNAYCQDNEISWFDWDGVTRHREMLTFWQKLLHWMQSLRLFEQETRFKVESYPVHRHVQHPYVVWHGTELGKQGWHEDGHALALEMVYPSAAEHLYIILNSYWESLPFTLPPYDWQRLLDTHLPEPITPTGPQITTPQYQANPRSSVILRRFAPSDATAD